MLTQTGSTFLFPTKKERLGMRLLVIIIHTHEQNTTLQLTTNETNVKASEHKEHHGYYHCNHLATFGVLFLCRVVSLH